MSFSNNTKVKWKWGQGYGESKIEKVFTFKVTRTIEKNEVTRNASEKEPAYLIVQDDGDRILKSDSKIEKA